MPQQIDELIRRIRELEEELENEFRQKREEFQFIIKKKRILFADEVVRRQRKLKTGLIRYIVQARPLNILVAPIIYSGLIPIILLDIFLNIYQTACFPIYRIPKVRRSDYLVFDREDLPYLNIVEKFNCFYCSYANGLATFFREIAARTEQYWCPIKHARKIKAAHDLYPKFFEYGDAETFRKGLERLRNEYEKEM
jgi:hypothetical protein